MEKEKKQQRSDNHVRHEKPLMLTTELQDGSSSDSVGTKLKYESIHTPVKQIETQTLLVISSSKTKMIEWQFVKQTSNPTYEADRVLIAQLS